MKIIKENIGTFNNQVWRVCIAGLNNLADYFFRAIKVPGQQAGYVRSTMFIILQLKEIM